jgi:signal transduction histidine kinase/GAF domain-containing protein
MSAGPPLSQPVELDQIASAVLAFMGANEVWIAAARPDDSSAALVPVAAVGVQPSGYMRLDPARAPQIVSRALEFAARGRYILPCGDLSAETYFAHIQPRPQGSLICVPIHERGRAFVALVAVRAWPREFTEIERQVALLYAQQTAMAVHLLDAAALDKAQARERDAQLAATRALTSGTDAEAVIAAIASEIRRVIACDAALIYRADTRAGTLRVVAGQGAAADRLAGSLIAIRDQRSLAARVAQGMRASYNAPLSADESGSLTSALATPGPAWLVCEPLLAGGRLLGVVMLARARMFEDSEQPALNAFSALAAAALERAELFDDLRAQRDRRAAMFAAASDAFALIDRDLRFVEVNQAFASYLDVKPDQLSGQWICQALNETFEAEPRPENCLLCRGGCRVRGCLEGGAASGPFACVFPPRAGEVAGPDTTLVQASAGRDVAFTLTPVNGPEGSQALLVGRDISDDRDMERRRMQFLQELAHEVRQPLQTASSNLENALYYSRPDLSLEERQRLEGLALGGVKHAAAGVADIVTVSERTFGQFAVSPIPGDLSVVARQAASETESLAKLYGVRLYVIAPDGLPLALIDFERAQQVARNLLINALKFTPSGGWARISTSAGSGPGARWVELVVEDSGPGIPPESLERIFDRRYRAPTQLPQGRPTGSGIGLAVVRYIMQGHDGGYWAENLEGAGARFIMRFPRA